MILTFLLAGSAADADVVVLKCGEKVSGKVIDRGRFYTVYQTGGRHQIILKDRVRGVVRDVEFNVDKAVDPATELRAILADVMSQFERQGYDAIAFAVSEELCVTSHLRWFIS